MINGTVSPFDVMYKKYKKLVYKTSVLLARFCILSKLVERKKFGLICFPENLLPRPNPL